MDWYFVVSCMDSLIPYVPFRRLILCSNLHGFIDSLCSLSWIGTLQLSSFYWLFFIFTDMDSLFPYFRIVVSNTCCVLFVFILCTLCSQFLWIVHFWWPHSVFFISLCFVDWYFTNIFLFHRFVLYSYAFHDLVI
jgi:hypothetical protein